MAEINQAWHVLGDAARRRDYDLSLPTPARVRTATSPVAVPVAAPEYVAPRFNPLSRYQDPPRFPWRLMGVLALLGVGLVLLGVFTAGDPVPPKVDNVLRPGDCVAIDANGDAAERLCSEAHDGTVEVLLATSALCPEGSEPHRDRQGMGTACVRMG